MKIQLIGFASLAVFCMAGCSKQQSARVQGYVEGEFVYLASPRAGALEKLAVQRGAQVQPGVPLFTLESGFEKAALEEAKRRLLQLQATLADVQKGKRPQEIAAIEAQLKQARAALSLSEIESARQEELFKSRANSMRDVDLARTTRDQDRQRVLQFEADLAMAQLGARTDQIAATEAGVNVQEAAIARAQWDLSQKQQNAPVAGQIFDTLYREGEWVAAGRPVIALLPPQNIKLRAFVPEPRIAGVKVGAVVRVFVDGAAQPVTGKVSFISPQAEFTPPVIYSQETRAKLVFLIEAVFEPSVAEALHPGQPVDVEF